MRISKFTVKLIVGVLAMCGAVLVIYLKMQPKMPNGLYCSYDGSYSYDFQSGGTGAIEENLNTMYQIQEPFNWNVAEDDTILVYLSKHGRVLKWDSDDLIILGSNTRLSKK